MSLSNHLDSTDGLNKEFAVATISDVTIYIDSSNTSANDTAVLKYFDNQLTNSGAAENNARAIFIRNDQTIQIVSINNTTFTDPETVIADKGHRETWDKPHLWKLVIRTTVVNTNIKIRVK